MLALNITESVPPLFIKCRFHVDGPYFRALFDTGASISLIDPSLVNTNQLQVMTAPRSQRVALAGGIAGPRLCQMVEEDIWIGDAKYKCAAFVMPLGTQYQAILGLNFILTHGFLTGATILKQVMPHTTHPFMVSSLATDPHREELCKTLLNKFSAIFPEDIGDIANYPPICNSDSKVRHHINLTPGAVPFRSAGYRSPHMWHHQLAEEIQKHRAAGRLRPSSSLWAAPAFLIKKGKWEILFHL